MTGGVDTVRRDGLWALAAELRRVSGSSAVAVCPPEVELLLCCSRTESSLEDRRRVSQLAEGVIDWLWLCSAASRHGVVPLVYRSLRAICPQLVPSDMMARLRRSQHVNAAWCQILAGELLRILRLFESCGVQAIPFKGPVLAVLAYGDLDLRQYRDLDLFVRKEQARQASELLLTKGYSPSRGNGPGPGERSLDPGNHCSRLEHGIHRYRIDLHQQVTNWSGDLVLDDDLLWRSQSLISLCGKHVPSLTPEAALLVSCMHGTAHAWQRLAWACDVAELTRHRQDMDWDLIRACATKGGCRRMLSLGLSLAHRLLDAPLPEPLLRWLRGDRVTRALANHVQARSLANRRVRSIGLYEWLLLDLGTRERLLDWVRGIGRLFLQPQERDLALWRLPQHLQFLHYILRPLRVGITYFVAPLLRCLLRNPGAEADRSSQAHRHAVTTQL